MMLKASLPGYASASWSGDVIIYQWLELPHLSKFHI